MEKYYIYLNGRPYIEIPEEYGIRQDVYMNYNDLIEQYLKDKGLAGRAIPYSKKIQLLKEFIANPQHTDMVIRHELTHIKQIQDNPNYSLLYKRASKKYGYGGNPFEVEAKRMGNKYLPLHRIGTFDIDYQKQLERWQKEKPKIFKAKAEEEKKLAPQNIAITYKGYTPSSYKKPVTYTGRRGGIFE